MHRLEVLIIVIESFIAAQPIPRGHAVRLVAVQARPVRTIVARILALIQEIVRNCLVHDTLPSDKRAALRNE